MQTTQAASPASSAEAASQHDVDDAELDAGPEQSLLHPSNGEDTVEDVASGLTPKGKLRAYWLGLVVCIGGFLFGYDSGIIGGVLVLPPFERDFGFDPNATAVSSLAVSLQQLGALVACFAIWPVTHRFGRRWAIAVCSAVFCVGSLLQTINSHSRLCFYLGRIIAGLGLGGSSVVVPMFSSEMTPPQIRGQIGSFYQLMYTLGIFTSYWIDYGVARGLDPQQSTMWQLPVGLQLLWAFLLGLGMFTVPESARWLSAAGRHAEAWRSLRWIRADDGPAIELEMEQIRRGVETERHAKEGFHLREMFDTKDNLRRTMTAIAVFTAQQATGATAFAYYGPQYFRLLVGSKDNSDLLLTAIFGAVKVAACGTFVLFVADSLPRRYILTGGALFMGVCQIATATLLHIHPTSAEVQTTPSGIATVALIYLFVIAYNFSWGPLPWPYVSEIFPTRTREPGIAIGVASQWLFNFVFSLTTPYMIKNLGWGTFLLWGVFDLGIAAYSWYGLWETRGRSLEDIVKVDRGFGTAQGKAHGPVRANDHGR